MSIALDKNGFPVQNKGSWLSQEVTPEQQARMSRAMLAAAYVLFPMVLIMLPFSESDSAWGLVSLLWIPVAGATLKFRKNIRHYLIRKLGGASA